MAVSATPGDRLTFSDKTLTLLVLVALGDRRARRRLRDLRGRGQPHAIASPADPSGWTTRCAACWTARPRRSSGLEQAVRTLNKTDKQQQGLIEGSVRHVGAVALRRVRGRGRTALVLVRPARRPRHRRGAHLDQRPPGDARLREADHGRTEHLQPLLRGGGGDPAGARRARSRRWRRDDLQEGRGRRDPARGRGSRSPGRGSEERRTREGRETQMAENGEVTVVGVGARLEGTSSPPGACGSTGR